MLTFMLSSCLVYAFCLWEHLTEVTAADKVAVSRESRVINFTCSLIEELCPTLTIRDDDVTASSMCHLVKLPKTATTSGANAGREYRTQDRYAMCIIAGRKEKPGSSRAAKAVWVCAVCKPPVYICSVDRGPCLEGHGRSTGD